LSLDTSQVKFRLDHVLGQVRFRIARFGTSEFKSRLA